MNRVLTYIIDTIILILVIFISVTIYFGLRTETVVKTIDKKIERDFISDIQKSGSLTLRNYEVYLDKLSLTDTLYDITFEHEYKVWEPEYRMKTTQEIIEDQNAAYQGQNVYTYKEVHTQIPEVNDPVYAGSLNSETNASVLASAVNTPADSNHVHTDECYGGHVHTQNPTSFTHYHNHISGSCIEYLSALVTFATCTNCNREYLIHQIYWYWNPFTRSTFVSAQADLNKCPYCSATGTTNVYEKTGFSYSCGYNKDLDGDGYPDLIGYAVSYEYQLSTPQVNIIHPSDLGTDTSMDGRTSYTETRGCYTYHSHGDLTFNGAEAIKDFRSYGIYSFCSIPTYYHLYLYDSRILGGMSAANFYYTASLQADGSVIFQMTSYNFLNPEPQANFPSTLSATEFLYWFKNTDRIISFVQKYCDPNFYTTYETSKVYLSGGGDNTTMLDICSYDTVNQWYLSCDKNSGTLQCNQIVKSISPTHPIQTVAIGDPLITTVKATYLDGSTKVVIATTTFSTASISNNQTVTLTYNYTVAGVSYSKTCNITVSVIARTKTCKNGHTYNLSSGGSDPGCPYCKSWIKSIQFINPATSYMTITIGTTLQENGVSLLVTYMDNHTETITDGYIDNLDKNYLGIMIVTIGYKGVNVQLRVTTICKQMRCDICGNDYNLYPDGTDPGCPNCLSKIPVFTGNVSIYEEARYTEDILETLFQEGIYQFNKNDRFKITLRNRSTNIARRILRKFLPSISERWVELEYSEKISTNQ